MVSEKQNQAGTPSASTLQYFKENAVNALSCLKAHHLAPEAELTLVMRIPGVDGVHLIISNDDLQELSELLRTLEDPDGE